MDNYYSPALIDCTPHFIEWRVENRNTGGTWSQREVVVTITIYRKKNILSITDASLTIILQGAAGWQLVYHRTKFLNGSYTIDSNSNFNSEGLNVACCFGDTVSGYFRQISKVKTGLWAGWPPRPQYPSHSLWCSIKSKWISIEKQLLWGMCSSTGDRVYL